MSLGFWPIAALALLGCNEGGLGVKGEPDLAPAFGERDLAAPSVPSCTDGLRNGDETDVDCGGAQCGACTDGQACKVDTDCASGLCANGTCRKPGCDNGVQDGQETDVDCGGLCLPCALGDACTKGRDCVSGWCEDKVCIAPPLRFIAGSDYYAGAQPAAMALADYDNDGFVDIATIDGVTTDGVPRYLRVLHNQGDGRFRALAPVEVGFAAAPAQLCRLAAGDFNRDKKIDLAALQCAHTPGSDVLYILRGDGKGGFASTFSISAGPNGTALATGDVNGDGKLDVIVGAAAFKGAIGVLYGKGDGTLADQVTTPTPDLTDVATGDLNGDGRTDVVAVGAGIRVYLGAAKPPLDMAYEHAGSYVAVALADLDGDGALDAATANVSGTEASVFRGGGNGTLVPVGDFGNDAALQPVIAIADLNGDKRPDVLARSSRGLDVLLNEGGGRLGAATSYVTEGPAALAAADLDGDARVDVAVTAVEQQFGYVRVFRGKGDGTLIAAPTWPGYANGPVIADFNVDGKPDVASMHLAMNSVEVRLGDGKGGLGSALSTALPKFPPMLAPADFDGDGKPDLAVPLNTVSVLPGAGDGTFGAARELSVGGTGIVIAADFDRDGHPDVCTRSGVLVQVARGRGDGTFAAAVESDPRCPSGFGLVAGDVNGDKVLDLTVTCDKAITVMLGRGDGTFGGPAQIAVLDTYASALGFGDLDADGALDAIIAHGGKVDVYRGKGNGAFQALSTTAAFGQLEQIAVGDFDRDGHLDVAAANRGEVLISLGDGKGGLAPPLGFGGGFSAWPRFAVGDLDRDGLLDVVLGGRTATVLKNATK